MVRHSTTGYHKAWVPVMHWSDNQNYVLELLASMYGQGPITSWTKL